MRSTARIILGAAAVVATAAVLAGCGTSGTAPSGSSADSSAVTTAAPENNPAGDIPDNQVFVPFTPPGGVFTVSAPEGWARSTDGAATIFTDKANTVRIEAYALAAASILLATSPFITRASQIPFLFFFNFIGLLLCLAYVPRYLLSLIVFVHPHIELILIAVVVASVLPLFHSFPVPSSAALQQTVIMRAR